MKYEDSEKNVKIVAKEINIGKLVEFGKDKRNSNRAEICGGI